MARFKPGSHDSLFADDDTTSAVQLSPIRGVMCIGHGIVGKGAGRVEEDSRAELGPSAFPCLCFSPKQSGSRSTVRLCKGRSDVLCHGPIPGVIGASSGSDAHVKIPHH